jgi:putative FmdB family regulatory protein
MPNYSYQCLDCKSKFELFFYIKDYQEKPKCIKCNKKNTERMYIIDVASQSASVKKMDSELKTIGDLARRNSDRLSEDEKQHLYKKHNEYKDEQYQKPLPTGMSRVKKQPKIKWPGSTGLKKKRDIKK